MIKLHTLSTNVN